MTCHFHFNYLLVPWPRTDISIIAIRVLEEIASHCDICTIRHQSLHRVELSTHVTEYTLWMDEHLIVQMMRYHSELLYTRSFHFETHCWIFLISRSNPSVWFICYHRFFLSLSVIVVIYYQVGLSTSISASCLTSILSNSNYLFSLQFKKFLINLFPSTIASQNAHLNFPQ